MIVFRQDHSDRMLTRIFGSFWSLVSFFENVWQTHGHVWYHRHSLIRANWRDLLCFSDGTIGLPLTSRRNGRQSLTIRGLWRVNGDVFVVLFVCTAQLFSQANWIMQFLSRLSQSSRLEWLNRSSSCRSQVKRSHPFISPPILLIYWFCSCVTNTTYITIIIDFLDQQVYACGTTTGAFVIKQARTATTTGI